MKVLMLGWEFPPHISGGLGTACFGLTQGLAHHEVDVLFVVPRARGDEDERFVDVLGANRVPVEETVREKRTVRTRKVVEDRREEVEPVYATELVRETVPGTRRVARVVPVVGRAGADRDGRDGRDVGLARGARPGADGRASAGSAAAPSEPASRSTPADDALERVLEVIEVDSLLSPYQTERDYRVRWRRVQARAAAPRVVDEAASAPRSDVRELPQPEERFELVLEEVDEPREVVREARRAVGELRRVLVTPRDTYEETEYEIERVVTRPPLDFSGAYGPDLHAEVARYALSVAQIAKEQTFDVIHAHDWMAVPAGLAAKKVSGKPLVLHVHACEYDRSGDRPNTVVRDIEQLGLDGADRVVCVSHYTAGILQKRYKVDEPKLRVVHNAVTHEEQKERLHEGKSIDEPIVLFLGRVTFQKGPDYFLEAAALVVKAVPRVKFVMSGSGDMLPAMVERAARLGLGRNVSFTGFLKGADVERMYAMADIYVMPSVSEPFGISPLEAMALDVPVIVSRQSGVSEVLKNALKVDFWDVTDLANKIVALLRYPALAEQLSSEGWEEVKRIRWETPASKVRDVYRELVP